MKITVTGSLGNISKPLAELLISKGHEVTIISRNPHHIEQIEKSGASAAIGSVGDVDFLSSTFEGADAVYTMVPPNWEVNDYNAYIAQTGKNYARAIQQAGVKRVVNLSSVGAHLNTGNGPIAGLHAVEQTLDAVDGVAIKHLRAGIFYINYFFDISMIQNLGFIGNNYGSKTNLLLVHPKDIAAAAAEELESSFTGKSHRYVVSERKEVSEIVEILGTCINKCSVAMGRIQ